MHFAISAFFGRLQGSVYFCRVVAVIVNHGHAALAALDLKAAVYSAKTVQSFQNGCWLYLKLCSNGHGRCCVQNVVASGDMKLKWAEDLPVCCNLEAPVSQNTRYKIGLRIHSISEDAPLHARKNGGELRVVQTGNTTSVEGHAVHELDEGVLYVLHVAVAIHVLAVQVRDNSKNRRQLQKRAVALIGLCDQILRFAQTGVRSQR